MDINSELLLEFWKKGKTLYAALYEFTNSDIRQEYVSLDLKRNQENRNILENGGIPNFSAGLKELSNTLLLSNTIDNLRDKLKWDLLNKIISENLIGIGYEAPIKSSDKPQIIPLHVWPRKIKEINWDDNSISKNGIEFINIKVIKKSQFKIKNPIKKIPNIPVEDKKGGRPTQKDKIIAAYRHLKHHEKIDYSKNFKSHTKLIRETVLILYPELENDKGLGEEAIRIAAKPLFDADKTTLKPI